MVNRPKSSVFKTQTPRAETPMDKTIHIVREIADEEAEKRRIKNARLRSARLEREANTPAEPAKPPRKTRAAKAV